MNKKLLSGLIAIALMATGCNVPDMDKNKKVEKIARFLPEKEIKVLSLNKEKPDLTLTKSGNVEAENTVMVSPEISGRIVDINAKEGQYVVKGDILATIGDSLSTDVAEAQQEATEEALSLSKETRNLTNQTANNQIETAQTGVQMANLSYQNTLENKKIAQDTYQEQRKNSLIEIENAENTYKSARKGLNNAKDDLYDLKDDLDDIQDEIEEIESTLDQNPASAETLATLEATKSELETAIDALKAQIETTEYNVDTAKNRVEQTEINLNLLTEGYKSQLNGLNFAIDNAQIQYQNAQNQLKAAQTGKKLQLNQLDSQILQAQSNLKIQRFNTNQKNVRAPISGLVTKASAEEGNFTSPGQMLFQIEQTDDVIVKTSLSPKETKLIKESSTVYITNQGEELEGKISNYSPTLNAQTQKYDIEIKIRRNSNLLPGSLVKINFKPSTDKRIFIPLNTIFTEKGEKFVKVINKENIIEFKKVEIGEIVENYVEITNGLDGNEKIVISVNIFTKEGDKVKIASNEQ